MVIKYDILKRKRELRWKKFHQAFQDEQQKRILILLKIVDKIQQGNEHARKKIEKSITAICKEESISFELVFYILFFDAVYISNKSIFSF